LWGSTVPENFVVPLVRLQPAEVLLCDAGLFPGEPGSLILADPESAQEVFAFSHRLPLAFLGEQVAQRTGAGVHLLLMRPERLELREVLSPAVQESLDGLLADLRRLLSALHPMKA
jgi:Ni,Fe-hydrogenase maturation factor